MTAQAPDLIDYEGRRHMLFSNPLELLWEDHPPGPRFATSSSANWRGYVAIWSIEDGILYLENISGKIVDEDAADSTLGWTPDWTPPSERASSPTTLERLFPGSKGRVTASWYTGELRIPRGAVLEYMHMGYGSVFEEDLFIEVEKGHVVQTKIVDNRGKKTYREQLFESLGAAGEDSSSE